MNKTKNNFILKCDTLEFNASYVEEVLQLTLHQLDDGQAHDAPRVRGRVRVFCILLGGCWRLVSDTVSVKHIVLLLLLTQLTHHRVCRIVVTVLCIVQQYRLQHTTILCVRFLQLNILNTYTEFIALTVLIYMLFVIFSGFNQRYYMGHIMIMMLLKCKNIYKQFIYPL